MTLWMKNETVIIIWISIVLAVIVAWAIVKYFAQLLVVKPIEKINNAAKRLAKGDVHRKSIKLLEWMK